MGLLDGLAAQLAGQISGGGQVSALLPHVLGLLQGNQGGSGLQGLVQEFTKAGLGNVVSSWISTGPNLPITGSQLQSVLGSNAISQLATKSGLSLEDVSAQLSGLLPQVVDKLTPNGQLPEGGDLLGGAISGLKNLF